ncbi:SH2 domain and EF-hand domain pair-containing protein [Strongyloides ratti]|uniref:SH2 domain and EF-hand domain pair-containing protein n=1 Tax=Strongyloides ratti TaxID=34506 RepID=A0A090LSB6_STRRB|nr:SH2 domain and EF-hand domain pair-containing protein [Strongyloides ratti]CEF70498.1 SH2 domain and EF-hand domain pair-containing protein [Strongyloides ratti]
MSIYGQVHDIDGTSLQSQSPFSNIQSPATENAQIDQNFVYYHNISAEQYQIFKENVDMLFNGRIPLHEQQYHLSTIVQHVEEYIFPAFEQEKSYLINNVLCGWAIKQQKVSIGSVWSQMSHYKTLSIISTQFEYFGELLEQTLNGLFHLKTFNQNFQHFSILFERLKEIVHFFLYYSIIVSRQPPSVSVKCGDAENHRRSRFWFNTEIRVLGGKAFNIDTLNSGKHIKCHLITDETAKILLTSAYKEVLDNEDFTLEPMVSSITSTNYHETGTSAFFEDMRLSKKGPLRRDSVASRRYHLCYSINLSTKHDLQLIGKKVSLPFAVLVGPKVEVEARLFLERSFANLVQSPSCELPSEVGYEEMAEALEMKFQSIIETPLKSTDTIPIVKPRMLTNQAKHHIIMRLKPNTDAKILLDNFMKSPVAEEFCLKKGSTTDGEWKLVPFYDWFFKIAEIINKYMSQMWNNELIYGFCSKDEAEYLLQSCPCPTLLIRFSDIEYGKVKISAKYSNNEIQHYWYDTNELASRSLPKELLTNSRFTGVNCIYPNINLEKVLGGNEIKKTSIQNKPRYLQPSAVYFDNQGSAT